jgi:hypothetical protein
MGDFSDAVDIKSMSKRERKLYLKKRMLEMENLKLKEYFRQAICTSSDKHLIATRESIRNAGDIHGATVVDTWRKKRLADQPPVPPGYLG